MTERLILGGVRVHGWGHHRFDVLLEGGKVAAFLPAGTAENGDRLALDGATVLPGLWDRHVHLEQWALRRRQLDVSSPASAAETVALIRTALKVRGSNSDDVLVGYGFRDGLWNDAPEAGMLDLGPRPVLLLSADLHATWANQAAMARAGWPEHPGGILREEEAFALNAALTTVSRPEMDAWVLDAVRAAAERGIVGIVDLEMQDAVSAWERRAATGAVPVRIRAGVYSTALEEIAARGLHTGTPLDPSGRVVVGPLKVITDGSLNTRTAWCHDPYPDTDQYGDNTFPPQELEPLLRRGLELGFTPAVHAIGDAANGAALDVFERIRTRGSIEHAQLVTEHDVARMASLGLVASIQPEHAMDDRDIADRHWNGRTSSAFMARSFLDAGVELALGSDAPVAPLDPWLAIQAATERTRDGREPWHPEQRISTKAAIAASSRTGGVVSVGDIADLIVVPDDPTTQTGQALRETPVLLTFVDAKIVADLR